MGLETSFTPRFRQRKISLKQNLRILWERNLPDAVEDVRGDLLGIVETGVDKSEEDERHLQAVLNSATLAGKIADAYIPTPEATKKFAEYSSYYSPGWVQTESYIRSSATVEDAQGVDYCMDATDLKFLESVLNKNITDTKARCSEDEFESVCSLIESVIADKQPFLSTDVTQLMMYKEAEPHIFAKLEEQRRNFRNPLDPERLMAEANSPDYAPRLVPSPYRDLLMSVKLFGASIYAHWRSRKLKLHGKSIKPSVLFESGLASDDQNPYVTFRRREVRHTRKTRRTDQQNSGRLRKLHGEMHEAQAIFELILKRERSRLQQIQTDFEVFELRCRVKALKRKLGIEKEPDDVDLLVSVSKRARQEEAAKQQREEADRKRRAQLAAEKLEREREKREKREESNREARASAAVAAASASETKKSATNTAAGSRIPVLEHVTVEQQAMERGMEIEEMVAIRMQQRKDQDIGWIDVSDSATVPFFDFFAQSRLENEAAGKAKDSDAYKLGTGLEAQNNATSNPHDLFYSAIELRNSVDFVSSGKAKPNRLSLPDDTWMDDEDINFHESPEVIHVDGRGTPDDPFNTQLFSEVDFRRQPSRFSVPKDKPSAILRKRRVGGLTYIDRVLPAEHNPLSQFGKQLLASPQSDADERLADRFKYDQDLDIFSSTEDLLDDPARLNEISPKTQNLRFSSMLTGKAIDIISDAQTQRRKAYNLMFQRMQQQQKQQKVLLDAQALRAAQAQANNSTARVQQAQKAAQRQIQRRKIEDPNAKTQSLKTVEKPKLTKPFSGGVGSKPALGMPNSGQNSAHKAGGNSGQRNPPVTAVSSLSQQTKSQPNGGGSSSGESGSNASITKKRSNNSNPSDQTNKTQQVPQGPAGQKGAGSDQRPLSRKPSSTSNTANQSANSANKGANSNPGTGANSPSSASQSNGNKFPAQMPKVEASV